MEEIIVLLTRIAVALEKQNAHLKELSARNTQWRIEDAHRALEQNELYKAFIEWQMAGQPKTELVHTTAHFEYPDMHTFDADDFDEFDVEED